MGNGFVSRAYDQIADTYVRQRDQFRSLPYLERFADFIPPSSQVLDIGCGGGLPADLFLIERGYQVHGLDISSRMIELASSNVASATYEIFDMSDLQPNQFSVAGIVSLYALFHTPRERHGAVLGTFASFLPIGGAMLITMGSSEWEGTEDFHGTSMSWSHYGPERNIELVTAAGCQIELDTIDDSGNEAHQIIIAIKTRHQNPDTE